MSGIEQSVAVIVPTYNRAELVTQTLDSLLAQTRPADEIILIDDGSTDSTAEVVADYEDRVRCLRQANTGKSAALNRAMKTVHSTHVWIMDDDDVALPNALANHLALLRSKSEIDFTYSSYCEFEGNAPPDAETVARLVECPDWGQRNFFIRTMLSFPFLMQGMLVPLHCYRRVGGFDETLTFNEDYDMILRLTRYFRGGRLPEPTFYFRLHPGPRGPGREQYTSNKEREVLYRQYNRQVFCALRDELPLDEYLPRTGEATRELDATQRRQALLQRSCVLARHAVFDKAFEDLTVVCDAREAGQPFTAREQRIFAQMLNVEAWWLRNYPRFSTAIRRFLRTRNTHAALDACARGLLWRLDQDIRCRRYRNVLTISIHLRRLLGFRRLVVTCGAGLFARFGGRVSLGQ